jgi:hypothetical protein
MALITLKPHIAHVHAPKCLVATPKCPAAPFVATLQTFCCNVADFCCWGWPSRPWSAGARVQLPMSTHRSARSLHRSAWPGTPKCLVATPKCPAAPFVATLQTFCCNVADLLLLGMALEAPVCKGTCPIAHVHAPKCLVPTPKCLAAPFVATLQTFCCNVADLLLQRCRFLLLGMALETLVCRGTCPIAHVYAPKCLVATPKCPAAPFVATLQTFCCRGWPSRPWSAGARV